MCNSYFKGGGGHFWADLIKDPSGLKVEALAEPLSSELVYAVPFFPTAAGRKGYLGGWDP